jgi:hypothetical protein
VLLLSPVLAVICLTIAACNDTPFDTHADQAQLAKAKNGLVALIAFQHVDHRIIDAEPPSSAAVDILLAHDKERFLAQYGRVFRLVDATAMVSPSGIDGREALGRVIRSLNFDAGFVVGQSYGFEMMGGDLADEAREKILEILTSKKIAQAINGPAMVQDYDIASDVLLVDNSGHIIWHLFGKAQDYPRPADIFNAYEFARSFAGLDPSLQLMVRSMSRVTDLYTDIGAWAAQQSIEGTGPPRFKVFLGDRWSSIKISPVDDLSNAPFICGYDLMAASRAQTGAPPPRGCR